MVTKKNWQVAPGVADQLQMHELGIAESAIRAALQELENRNAKVLRSMTLRIGGLSCVDPEALRFAFEAVTRSSGLEQAELKIELVEPVALCKICNEEFMTESSIFFKCPNCGNFTGELLRGKEIELARLEME